MSNDFELDISELEEYFDNLQKATGTFDDFIKDFLQEMANRVLSKVKPKTPVDTGALRSGWQLGSIQGIGKDIYIEIKNPMEYATEIEYGHRIVRNGVEIGWYEGRFMLKTSIDEVEAQIPLRWEKQFQKWWEGMGL